MRLYTEYTSTFSRDILCLFKCNKCNKINVSTAKIFGQGRQSTRYTRDSFVDAEDQAKGDAQGNLDIYIQELKEQPDVDKIYSAHVQCRCPNCGKAPFWTFPARHFFPLASKVAVIVLLLLFIAAGMSLIKGKINEVVFWICISIIILRFIVEMIYTSINKKRFNTIPLPLFAETLSELKEKKIRYQYYKDFEIND